MKTIRMVYKSFSKPRKYFILLASLIGVAIAFISFIDSYSYLSYELQFSDRVYGNYTGTISEADYDLDEICSVLDDDKNTEFYIPFYSEYISNYPPIYHYGVNEDFWDKTEFELIEGKLPQTDNEAAFEKKFLIQKGFAPDNMIGNTIEINETNYYITGIYTRNLLYNDLLDVTYIITALNQVPNALILKFKDSMIGDNCFIKSNMNVQIEMNPNDYIKNGERISFNYFHSIIFVILLISTIFIVSHCIALIMRNHRKHISIYDLIGVPKRRIWIALSSKLIISALCGIIIAIIIYSISFIIITVIFKSICDLSLADIIKNIPVSLLVINLFLYLCALIVFMIIRSWIAVFISKINDAKNEVRIRTNKRVKNFSPYISSSRIARRHLNVSLFSNIFTMLTLSVVITTYVLTGMFIEKSSSHYEIYEGYDYEVLPLKDFGTDKYIPYDLFCNSEEVNTENYNANDSTQQYLQYLSETTMKYIEEQEKEVQSFLEAKKDDTEYLLLYNFSMKYDIPIKYISTETITYLREYTDAHDDILNGNKTVPLNIVIIGLSDEELVDIGSDYNISELENNQCILFTKFTDNVNVEKQLLYNTGDTLTLGEKSIDIVLTKSKYSNKFIDTDDSIVICVSEDFYAELYGIKTPSAIYFKVNDNMKNSFETDLSFMEYIKFTDLNESIQAERLEICQDKLYVTSMIFMLVFCVFSCLLTIYMRCVMFEKEYSTFNALGLPSFFSRMVVLNELLFVITPAIIGSWITISVICGVINLYSDIDSDRINWPFWPWAGAVISVLAIGISCALLLINKFDRYSSINLQE